MADSDLEDGVEKFEVTDSDLQFGFNPGNRRRQTKHQATYGRSIMSYYSYYHFMGYLGLQCDHMPNHRNMKKGVVF